MRHFTPEEANAALEEVRPLVEMMVAHRRSHVEALARQEQLEGRIRGNGGGIPPAELADSAAKVDREARELARVIDELTEYGVQVKDIDDGLVDFSAGLHGETVLLCWRLGEDEVGYWHTVEAGFAGRRRLPFE